MSDSLRPPLTLTRQQLYDRVWSVSAVQLAKSSASHVAVARRVSGTDPKPPLGYWGEARRGKAPPHPGAACPRDPKLQSVTFFAPAAAHQAPRIQVMLRSVTGRPSFRSSELIELLSRISNSELSWGCRVAQEAPPCGGVHTGGPCAAAPKRKRYVRPGGRSFVPESQRSDVPLLDIASQRNGREVLDSRRECSTPARGRLCARQHRDQYGALYWTFHHPLQFGFAS